MNIGIEMEFWVVDESGRLCDGQPLTDEHELIKPEFVEPLVEIKTTPHEREDALRRELADTLETAIAAADREGKHLVPLGTPLTTATPDTTTRRGELFEAIYGEDITSAKNCAGTHVHYERDTAVDGEHRDAIDVLNLLTGLDPALALVSSSPYYCGERRRHCERAHAYRQRDGGRFHDLCDLWAYTDSVADWESTVAASYERFVECAVDRGVDAAVVAEHFSPEDTVLTPVRLREELPTVEWRAPDTCLPSQAVRLAVDVGRVVDQTASKPVVIGDVGVRDDEIGVPAFDDLEYLVDLAIEDGLDAAPVRSYLRGMGLEPDAYSPLAPDVSGPEELPEWRARELRLAAAQWLRADVATMAGATADPGPPTVSA